MLTNAKSQAWPGVMMEASGKAYLYQVVDNEWTMHEFGHQAVVWQTAVHPVIACELIAEGALAVEFVLEGLHLSRRLNKDRTAGGIRYRR